MSVISDAGRSQGDLMYRLQRVEDTIRSLQTARRLESASIGTGGIRVRGGRIRIEDAAGNTTFDAATDGLTLEGLLRVLGSIQVEDGGDIRVLDGGGVIVEGGGGVAVQGGAGVDLQSGAELNVQGGGGVVIQGGAGIELQDGAGMTVDVGGGIHVHGEEGIRLSGVGSIRGDHPNDDPGIILGNIEAHTGFDSYGIVVMNENGGAVLEVGENKGQANPAVGTLVVRSGVTTINSIISMTDLIGLETNNTVGVQAGNQINLRSSASPPQVRIDAGTTSNSPNVHIFDGSGRLAESTSSRRWKTDVQPAEVDVDALLSLQPKSWVDTEESVELSDDDGAKDGHAEQRPERPRRHVGLIAEDVHDAGLTEFVTYDHPGGPPRSIDYGHLTAGLLAAVQRQQSQIDALTERVAALESV